jgi:hypothetical protein
MGFNRLKNTLRHNNSLLINLTKGVHSYIIVIGVTVLFLFAGFTLGNYTGIFSITREQAGETLKQLYSGYTGLLGVGLAILAVLLAVIQLAYKRLSIVKIVLENAYFAPLFYFGLLNIIICTMGQMWYGDKSFFPDRYFTRMVVTENYLFFFFIILLAFVFYKTFSFSNFTTIIDLYIDNVKKNVLREKNKEKDKDNGQSLQLAAAELKSEIDAAIEENKIIVIDKIFKLYLFIQKQHPASNILFGFRIFFRSWLIAADKQNNVMVMRALYSNWWMLFQSALRSQNEEQIQILRLFAVELYRYGQKPENAAARDIVTGYFPIHFRDMFNMEVIKARSKGKSVEEALLITSPILLEFSELIKQMSETHDLQNLKDCLNELSLLTIGHEIEDSTENIRFHLKLVRKGLQELMPNDALLYHYRVFQEFSKSRFAIVFGNLAWLYFRSLSGHAHPDSFKRERDELSNYITKDNFELISFTAKLFNEKKEKYNWSQWIWHGEERVSGKAYFVESEEKLLAIGFIASLIKNGIQSAPAEDVDPEDVEKMTSMLHWIDTVLKEYTNKAVWAALLAVPEEDVEHQFTELRKYLEQFEKKKESINDAALVAEPISKAKVEAFRQKMYQQWIKGNTLTKVFEFYQCVVRNPEEKLVYVGQGSINFERAKAMFTEKHSIEIGGIHWGYQVNERINDYFIDKIFKSEAARVDAPSCQDVVQKVQELLNPEEGESVVIFFPFISQHHLINLFSGDNRFQHSKQLENAFPFEYTGIYDQHIIWVPLRSKLWDESCIAIKLPGSMLLKRREGEDWMDKLLQVDIKEITKDKAEEIAKQKYAERELNEELYNEIMAGIIIEINETLALEITDPAKIVVFKCKI